MTYEWREWTDPQRGKLIGLLPTDESNPYSLRRVAYIYPTGNGQFCGSYYYPLSTGNREGNGVFKKTRKGCQRWIERQLAGFWEPPAITNPVKQ